VFQRQVGAVHAVDGVSFDVKRGETLGLVGESGCGKSTTGRAILQLYKPTAGEVLFEDSDLVKLKREEMRWMRRQMQMIFQDPYASLNPRMTVAEIVGEPLIVHNVATGKEIQERVMHLLELVGLNPSFAGRYPHGILGWSAPTYRRCARHLHCSLPLLFVMNQFLLWMCPSRRRW